MDRHTRKHESPSSGGLLSTNLGGLRISGRSTGRDATLGTRPAGIERTAGLVELDDERRVIRRHRLALARLAVDLGEPHTLRHRRGHEQVVDPHPEVLVEVAGAVVPPRVAPRLAMMEPVR